LSKISETIGVKKERAILVGAPLPGQRDNDDLKELDGAGGNGKAR